jgi:hypothetical membrane protein
MRAFGICGMLGVVWFSATVLLLHFAAGVQDWTRHYVSEFANGPTGWLFGVGLFGNAAGNALVAFGLFCLLPRGAVRAAATTLFLCAAAGLVLAGVFDTDPPGVAMSAAGLVHRSAVSAAFAVGLLALALFSGAFAARPDWRLAARVSTSLTALAALASVALLLAFLFGWRPGLVERIAVAPFLAWEFWAGVHLVQFGDGARTK